MDTCESCKTLVDDIKLVPNCFINEGYILLCKDCYLHYGRCMDGEEINTLTGGNVF